MKFPYRYLTVIAMTIIALLLPACSDDDEDNTPDVRASFTYSINPNTGTVTFINISENASTYTWDFGDGTSSSEINPIKTYPNGTYTVVLMASNYAGASATAEDTFTILIPEVAALPLTFDEDNVVYDPTVFGGVTFQIVDNPDESGANDKATRVGEIVNSGAAFEGLFFDLGLDVDLTEDKRIAMNFWSDTPVDLLLKLEEGSAAAVEVTASHGGSGWEEVFFDFASSDSYSRLTLFVDGPGTTSGTFYIDDVTQEPVPAGGPVVPTAAAPAPMQDPANVISVYSDAYTNVTVEGFNLYGAAAFEEVEIAGENALRYTSAEGDGGNFQVIELGGANQIDAAGAGMTNFHFDLWFPNEVTSETQALLKLVDIPGAVSEAIIPINATSTPPIAQGTWLQFDFTFSELEQLGLTTTSNIQQLVIDLINSGELYIDNIYFYKEESGGGSIPPTTAAPAPTQDASDVISIYSDAFTDVPVEGFNFYGAAALEEVDIAGDKALKYSLVEGDGGNFQVIELGGANQIDAAGAGMTNFHFDLWFPNEVTSETQALLKLVDIPGAVSEAIIPINATSTPAVAQGTWLQFDYTFAELEQFGLTSSSNIQQVVIDLINSGELYMDNIYFYKTTGGGGSIPPSAAAPAPDQDPADVISIYSDAYTDVPVEGFNFYGSAAFEEVDLAGDKALKYTFVEGGGGNFQVIELGGANQIDATAAGMTNFRIDLWFPNEVTSETQALLKLVDIPGAVSEAIIPINATSTPAIAQGTWLRFDYTFAELEQFGLTSSSNIQQVVIDLINSGEVYVDNIYFYKQ